MEDETKQIIFSRRANINKCFARIRLFSSKIINFEYTVCVLKVKIRTIKIRTSNLSKYEWKKY